MQHNNSMNGNLNRHWEIQSEVDSFTFERFAECMADIADSIKQINTLCREGQLETHSLNRAARNVSVAVRKLMFDGNGYLFKECVEPRLHPLKDPKRRPKKGLRADVLVERIEGMSIDYTLGESEDQRTFDAPAYEHRTVVNPLYGLRRTGKEQYQLDDPFDLSRQPIKYGQWMNIKVLQVGDAVLSAERILQLLANYEGAHVESNQMTRSHASSPVDIKLPDPKDELYRKGTWVTFGGVSYLHIFTLLVGVYLVNMMKETVKRVPEETGKRIHITQMPGSILQAPSRIATPGLLLKKGFNMGMVLQSTGDSFELVGNHEKPGITTIQIPGWT